MSLANNKKKHVYQYFDSFSLRQAHARNFALDKHCELVGKTMDREARRRYDEMTKEFMKVEKELDDINTIFPIKVSALDKVYRERDAQMIDVYLNIVNCYLRRQHLNKRRWQDMMSTNVIATAPVKSQDHLDFVRDQFPEIYHRQVDIGYLYGHHPKADIYEYGKAAHDRKCLSRKVVPVGQASGIFPANKPINVRHWNPGDDYTAEKETLRHPKLHAHLYEKAPKRWSTAHERERSKSMFVNARRLAISQRGATRLTSAVSEMQMIRDIAAGQSPTTSVNI